ncbi:MAG: PspA/IM30 family protein [Deltaproteobacteria bacterium]
MQNNLPEYKPRSFWKRPEGTLGAILLFALIVGGGYLLINNIAAITAFMGNVLGLAVVILALGVLLYVALDPKMRTLLSYMYKSAMRKVTSIFITIDPIGILKNYIDDMEKNLSNLDGQISNLMGQIRKINTLYEKNEDEINNNLALARKAKELNDEKHVLLTTRKAARLQDVNEKYLVLLKKMDILKRLLKKMYDNSEILLEDTKDQVKVKEEERKAIRTSHSAMKSAMNILRGDKDKRMMFDQAVEYIADDIAAKVGEMERMMELSSSFMESIDLENAQFEEKGLEMLENFEKKSTLLMLEGPKTKADEFSLDNLNIPEKTSTSKPGSAYDDLFK